MIKIQKQVFLFIILLKSIIIIKPKVNSGYSHTKNSKYLPPKLFVTSE